jgi:hypothetical protein
LSGLIGTKKLNQNFSCATKRRKKVAERKYADKMKTLLFGLGFPIFDDVDDGTT